MAFSFEIHAQPRHALGSKAARRMRRQQGMIPAVVYGADEKPVTLSIEHKEILALVKHEGVFSHIIKLNVDGKKQDVVFKALQRHPVKPHIGHVDFYRVSAKEALRINVPLNFVNEEESPGVKEGGVVSRVLTEIEISCLPRDLPESIDVDIGHLAVNEALHLSDLKLPKGVELVHELTEENNRMWVSVYIPREEPEEPVEAEPAAEGEAEPQADQSSPDADASDSDDSAEA